MGCANQSEIKVVSLPSAPSMLESQTGHKQQSPTLKNSNNPDSKMGSIDESNPQSRKITLKVTPQMKDDLEGYCKQMFDKYDVDKTGFLTLKEFRTLVKNNISSDLTEKEVRKLRKSLDDNSNNKVQVDELIYLFKKMMQE